MVDGWTVARLFGTALWIVAGTTLLIGAGYAVHLNHRYASEHLHDTQSVPWTIFGAGVVLSILLAAGSCTLLALVRLHDEQRAIRDSLEATTAV